MTRWRHVLLVVCGLVLLGALLSGRDSWIRRLPPDSFARAGDSAPLWSSTPQMSAEETAEYHWRKHGAEFPKLNSAAEYEAAAHNFLSNPPLGTLTKQKHNGDTVFYNPKANIFAVRAPNGAPRTMFKPDNGLRYWERQ